MLGWLFAFVLYFWLALALMMVGVLTRALALTVLWAWFVEPTFGLAPLSLPVAAGLIVVVYLVFSSRNHLQALRERPRRNGDGDEDRNSVRDSARTLGTLLLHELLTPTTAVVLGWILEQAVGA